MLKGKRPVFRLKLRKRDHVDCIPRAAFQERAIRAFAGAEFASDAQQGVNDNAAERRMILIWRPIHAVRNGAVLNARR